MIDAIVIGGGPAGSAAAIRLTQLGMQVRLYEKRRFPRSKLCGGFLSAECLFDLGELGVLEQVQAAGACPIGRVQISSCWGAQAEAPLENPGLSLSRERLDAILLDRARDMGVDVHQGVDGFPHRAEAPWTVVACGRRSCSKDEPAQRYYGIQAFFEGVQGVTDQVELDLVSDGYVGLIRQNQDRVNVCALASRTVLQERGPSLDDVLSFFCRQNRVLGNHLAGARRLTPWCAVGPVTMGVRQLTEKRCFYVGDSACIVDPFVGEGIAMGLRSARILQEAYERSPGAWEEAYQRIWHDTFRSVLRANALLRSLLGHCLFQEALVMALQIFPPFLRWLTKKTRSPYEYVQSNSDLRAV